MRLDDLAAQLGGMVVGDGSVEIIGVADVEAGASGTIVYAADARALAEAERSGASAVLLPADLEPGRKPAIRVPQGRLAFARLLALFAPAPTRPPGIHPSAVVGRDVVLGEGIHLGPFVVVGDRTRIGARTAVLAQVAVGADVVIGEDCLIHPQVTIRDGTLVGDRVTLHAGVVLGADGFGYAQGESGPVKIPHLGRVVVEDDVELGANTTVDRGTLGETRIGRGTKIDNLVQVAHNVRLGQEVLIAAQSGISGSATVGDRVVMAGQSGVGDHVRVAAGVVIGARAAVLKDVARAQVLSGIPARPLREERRAQALLRRLPELLERVRRLQKQVETLIARPARRPPRSRRGT